MCIRDRGKTDRVRQGYHCGMRIEFVYALLLTGVCLLFAEPIIRLFADVYKRQPPA